MAEVYHFNMYKEVISPILEHLDSEAMHVGARKALHLAESSPVTLAILEKLNYQGVRYYNPRLNVSFMGIECDNPGFVGAGWDKPGEAVLAWYTLGAAGSEIGTVVLNPQYGNPKRRQFMVTSDISINWLGFNLLEGATGVARNLSKYIDKRDKNNPFDMGIPVGGSVGINKEVKPSQVPDALSSVVKIIYPHVRYITLNHASPNLPEPGKLLSKQYLIDSVHAIYGAMDQCGERIPLLIKLSPDMAKQDVNDSVQVAKDLNTGLIASNTTVNPEIKGKYGQRWLERGGLAGNDPDYQALTTYQLAYIYEESGHEIPLIGVGAVNSPVTALEKIQAGGSLYQIVTGIRSEGWGVFGKNNRGLVEWMDQEGIAKISDAVGMKAKDIIAKKPLGAKF